MRLLIALAIATIALFASAYLTPSDFAQDYLAARAVLDHSDPNTRSTELAKRYGVPANAVTSTQTAHPPLVTLVALPAAMLAWPNARIVWEIGLAILTVVLVLVAEIHARDLILLSPAWIFGLALGNVDAVVICLALWALKGTTPRAAAWLGVATALKVYPALLIVGLAVTRRYREAVLSAVVAATLTAVATLLIGFDSLIGWLRFIPHNSDAFAVSMMNLSLTKVASLAGMKTAVVTMLGFIAVLMQRGKLGVDPLLPAILAASPLSWLQSLPLLSNRLSRSELRISFACSLIMAASWMSGVRWASYLGVVASFTLTGLLLVVYLRIYKAQDKAQHSQSTGT